MVFFWLACATSNLEVSIEKKTDLGSNQETAEETVEANPEAEEPASEPSNNEPSNNEPSNNEPSAESMLDNTLCGDLDVGKDIEMCVPNIALPNADNEMVSLHDFAGNVIFLDMSDYG